MIKIRTESTIYGGIFPNIMSHVTLRGAHHHRARHLKNLRARGARVRIARRARIARAMAALPKT